MRARTGVIKEDALIVTRDGLAGTRRAITFLMALVLAAALTSCTRTDVRSHPEARLVFGQMPDGGAPDTFGSGASVINTNPANEQSLKLRVEGGKLTNRPTVNGESAGLYTSGSLGGPVTNIGASWTFSPHGGTANSCMVLIISQTGVGHPIPMHLLVSPNIWSLGFYPPDTDGTSVRETLLWGRFDPPLRQSPTEVLQAQAWVAGDRIELQLPDGTRKVVNDPRIAQWPGNHATYETYYQNGVTDSRIGFTEIWARSDGV